MLAMATAKLALVGDRSPSVRAHGRIPLLIDALRKRDGIVLDPYWIPSTEADDLERFDGIWVVPGSPYTDPDKVVAAVRTARLNEIPFLGTCGGFQHAVLHLAEDLAGIKKPRHAEYGISDGAVIVELECSLVGHEGPITYAPGTLIARIAGVDRSLERYHCSYGIAADYIATLEAAGVVFGAHDQDGAPRALELRDHPFFLGTLFQPELAGDGTRAHPVIRAFAEAIYNRVDRGLPQRQPTVA
jgi:CTP synthase (UTP-ammonia lyase)